jgi:hypothetical protein
MAAVIKEASSFKFKKKKFVSFLLEYNINFSASGRICDQS